MSLELSGTTGVKGVAGSVSAPSIVGDDTNTGISFPSADTIKFSTGGVERMAITNSGVSGITAGITQADVWRFTSNLSCPTTPTVISANWEQVDTDSQANPIGSSMTQSSGTFTFPSTGKYLILVHQNHESTSGEGHYVFVDTYVTLDNSGYSQAARGLSNCSSGGAINSLSSSFFFDVTNVSTHKVRFYAYAYNNNQLLRGTTAYNENSYTFIKLGET
jgi:hypothetical protein